MLVLTRKLGEEIRIGDDIEVRVIRIDSGSVRLGITAPLEIGVYRKEIYEIMKSQNVLAAKTEKQTLKQLREILKKKGGE